MKKLITLFLSIILMINFVSGFLVAMVYLIISARELLQHRELIRVATKYPNIAKDYFYNKKKNIHRIYYRNITITLRVYTTYI